MQKRTDYDFSHSGIPLFEFSCSDLFTKLTGTRCEFLSVEDLGSFYRGDFFTLMSEEDYNYYKSELEMHQIRCEQMHLEHEPTVEGADNLIPERQLGSACPYYGQWWEKFWGQMWWDARRWQEIRLSMGRGKCRIVVRWNEWEEESEEDTKKGKRARSDSGGDGGYFERGEVKKARKY